MGSIRWMVLSPLLATQTPLGPLPIAAGWVPTVMVSTTLSALMLIRVTVPSAKLATHTLSVVTTNDWGVNPTSNFWMTAWVRGSIRNTVASLRLATHSAPPPYARPAGLVPTGIVALIDPSSSTAPTLLAASVPGPAGWANATMTAVKAPMATAAAPAHAPIISRRDLGRTWSP
jgi:hypothetical protein